MTVLRRSLAPAIRGRLRCLAAVADRGAVRVICGAGTPPRLIRPGGHGGFQIAGLDVLRGGRGLVVHGTVGDAEAIALPTEDGLVDLPLIRPEPLLTGRNVVLAVVNGEPPAAIAAWLASLVPTGADAALLINRLGPDGADAGLADALAALPLPSLVLDMPLPAGKPDLPAATHPYCAPEAPGRDRMEVAPDPWRSPLLEECLPEIAHRRFLTDAAAVLCLDPFDHVEAPVFAMAQATETGHIELDGRRIFPWRVRDPAAPALGDHICLPFDISPRFRRWCAAPAKAETRFWMSFRLSGSTPAVEPRPRAWRPMALRHPGAAVAQLVPKASLVEDPDLLALAERLGHRPVRPKPAAAATVEVEPGSVAIVTTMKNEGPFILDWLAHHRAIGVTRVLVYTNDCTDGTDTMLDLLQAKGLVQHRDNPFRAMPGFKPQHAALHAADAEPLVASADWLVAMDVDEYITIHAGDGTLTDLFAAMGEANMICLTWRLFGNADVVAFEDRPVTEQFLRCAPEYIRKPHQAWGFKTLYRNRGYYKKLGVHRPKGLKTELRDRIRWVNGSGTPMPEHILRNGWRNTSDDYGYALVTLNHYAVRSVESFLVKRDRGRVNHTDRDQGYAYWFRMNNNAEEDRAIQRRAGATAAEKARLLADPEIAAQHAACVAAHRAKIAELKARPGYDEMYETLQSERFRRLSRMHRHFGSSVFLAGPSVVPDELVSRDLPDDFLFTVRLPEGAEPD